MSDAPPLAVTPLAKSKLDDYLSEEPGDTVVRILLEDDGRFGLSLDERSEGDVAFEAVGLTFVVGGEYRSSIEGLKIDYLEQGASSGFSLTGGRPPAPKTVLRSETTPNPDARKFVLAFNLGPSGTYEQAEGAPEGLREVLELEGVSSLFHAQSFVTVTKTKDAAWSDLEPRVTEALSRLTQAGVAAATAKAGPASGELIDRLQAFIAADVAPFLQQDGGDIELVAVESGVAKVRLVGACGTCPSAVMTLRMGVERRLLAAFPGELTGLELADAVAS